MTDKEKAYIQSQFPGASRKVTKEVFVPHETGISAKKKPEDFLQTAKEKREGKSPIKEDLYGKTYEVEEIETIYQGLNDKISKEQFEK